MTDPPLPRARLAIACRFPECDQAAAMVELIPNGARYADGNTDLLHRLQPGTGTFR
jgi:hypothetical protein